MQSTADELNPRVRQSNSKNKYKIGKRETKIKSREKLVSNGGSLRHKNPLKLIRRKRFFFFCEIKKILALTKTNKTVRLSCLTSLVTLSDTFMSIHTKQKRDEKRKEKQKRKKQSVLKSGLSRILH